MKNLSKTLAVLFVSSTFGMSAAFANTTDNQTDDLTTILSGSLLPFRIEITQANFQLPVGLHSGVFGTYKGLWILISGRLNGLHGFGGDPFPADEQNKSIYVVNPTTGVVTSRLLSDPSSGLTQQQIDSLTVTSGQGYQDGNTLYMTGGYGVDTATGTFGTKPILTAVNLPGIVDWVLHPENPSNSVVKNISQVTNSIFQIAGGEMFKLGGTTQLVFGQNFDGTYTDNSNGTYSKQVRQFKITSSNGQLSVVIQNSLPSIPDPNFRRRDLNVLPVMLNTNNRLQFGLVAYAGVFTLNTGVWTVPVIINGTSNPTMADPNLATTFKQGMNQYVCAAASLYSRKYSSNYNIFFGGISYGFYSNGVFSTDSEIPFINQVTTIKMDNNGNFSQYLMANQYPVILSTRSNPGNQLLFGAGAYFIPANVQQYANTVINLDNIRSSTVIGYIVGGIMSTLANTNVDSDSAASPYVFKVTLVPTDTVALKKPGKKKI